MTRPDPIRPRIRTLLQRRPLFAALLASALGGALLTRLPLFEVPGFELSAAMALLMAVVGGWAGIAAARDERARLAEPSTSGAPAAERPSLTVALPFAAASALLLAVLALPFAAAVVGALLTTRCNPWSSLGFYLLLPIPSALAAAAAGTFVGFWLERWWTAALVYAGLLLGSIAVSLWPLWSGPQVFALNHLAGHFPGPLYDESLPIDGRVLWFRLATALWIVSGLAFVAALIDQKTGRLSARRPSEGPRHRAVALFTAAQLALFLIRTFSFELRLQTSADDLEKALGGRSETTHFILHFPRAKPEPEVRRLERDLEFKYEQVVAFLGAAPTGRVHAWFHESPEKKRQLVGAAGTDFAKPWRGEFHVEDAPFPHPVARHELAHVLAGAFGSPAFHVSARWLIGVNVGLVEGLAVAADNKADELTLDEWAAAMRRLKLAPDIRGIVGPTGFYRQPAARAYTLAGSFLRFLTERHGSAGLRAMYPAGDFETAFGKPLDALAAEWEAHLDALPLDERALHTAQVRFEPGSIFERPCAREVAKLREEAEHLRRADPAKSAALFRRCSAIEPKNPAYPKAEAEVARSRRDFAAAEGLLVKAAALAEKSAGARAAVLLDVGDLAWETGKVEDARRNFEEVLGLHRDRGTDRAAQVRLRALRDPELSALVRRFFAHSADLPELVGLQAFADARPSDAISRYLVGRHLAQRGAPADGIGRLRDARKIGLGAPELETETLRLLIQASYLAADCAGVKQAADEISSEGSAADRAWSQEWRERCAFEQQRYGALLPELR